MMRLRQTLEFDRQMTSLIEREVAAQSDDIRREKENWVDALIDYGHEVSFDRGKTRLARGITTHDGRMFWLVRREGKKHGYHAAGDDPVEAADEAELAWKKRRSVRAEWDFVETLQRDLLTGREKLRVRIEDAHASPLCSMGIEGFMRSIGMAQVRAVPGRVAALMMKIDPQVGFVIHQAWLRHTGESDSVPGLTATL